MCTETTFYTSLILADVSEQPLVNPEEMWFASEDSHAVNKYAMVSQRIMPERSPSSPSSVQNAKQIALTMELILHKGEKISMKINLKYAFMILFTPYAIRKE